MNCDIFDLKKGMLSIDIQTVIVKETENWIILNKPAGLITERNPFEESLESILFDYLCSKKKKPFVGIVHRLDRVTSGLIIFAKKKSILKVLNAMLEKKQIRKVYRAITDIEPSEKSKTLDEFITKDQKLKQAFISSKKVPMSKSCKLHYRLIKNGPFGYQLEIQLFTGRFHQIRAQLSHHNMPIIGDTKYGGKAIQETNKIYLHAYKLRFPKNTIDLPEEISVQQDIPS